MAQNKVNDGKSLDWTNDSGSDVANEEMVLIGALVGVADNAIAQNEVGTVHLCGRFTVGKETADVVTVGAKLYFKASSGNLTVTASGNTLIGTAATAAGNGDLVVDVLLNVNA